MKQTDKVRRVFFINFAKLYLTSSYIEDEEGGRRERERERRREKERKHSKDKILREREIGKGTSKNDGTERQIYTGTRE